MEGDSTKKIIIVAMGVCIVCSIFVSAATVLLHDKQEKNKRLDKIQNILSAADLLKDRKYDQDIEEIYKSQLTPEIIELTTGKLISKEKYTDVLNIEKFDIRNLTKISQYSQGIPSEKDQAKLKVIPKYMLIYFVKKGEHIEKVILPIYGKGLYSTLWGFIALGKDLKTVEGITFYDQGETPGLGGEISNPRWTSTWKGKLAYDENWELQLTVVKGLIDLTSPDSKHKVQAISGATLTSRGVNNLVRFWLGQDGYGAFIENLKKEI